MADCDLVTLLNTESGRDVRGQVLVSLLVSGILGDELEVLASNDDGSVHLGGDNGAGQDTATDGDETSEGALLVYVESRISFIFLVQFFLKFGISSRELRMVLSISRGDSYNAAGAT